MVTSKNVSAARTNRRPNDLPDAAFVDAIMAIWDTASAADHALAVMTEDALGDTIKKGFDLRNASPSTWAAFMEHELWKKYPKRRPKVEEQDDAPCFCLHIYFGDSDRATKRTSDHWRAFQQLERQKLSESEIVAEMVKGDKRIRELASQLAKDRKQSRTVEPKSKPAARVNLPREDPRETSPVGAAIDASTRRDGRIATTSVIVEFPAGLPGFDEHHDGAEVVLTLKKLAGGGQSYTAKLLKIKPRKAK